MIQQIENYIIGNWIKGDGDGQQLYNAVTGNVIATTSTQGINFAEVLQYARTNGYLLRTMTFIPKRNITNVN